MSISYRSGIQCLQHPNQQITNMCIHYNCLKPLCPDCVQIHTKFHQTQQIESWKHCVTKSAKSLQSTLDTLKQIYNDQNKYRPYKDLQTVENQNVKTLLQMKEKVHKIVDEIFLNHQQHLRSVIRNQYRIDMPDTTKLKAAIEQMEKLLMKLGHSGTIVSALKKILLLDHQSLVKYFGQMRNKQYKPVNQAFFMQNHDLYPKVRQILTSTLHIQNLRENTNKNTYQLGTPVYKQNRQMNQSQNVFEPLKLTVKNYFNDNCKHKYLHFFVPSSNQLKITDIQNIQNRPPSWSSLLFNTKNIITPSGQIFLTGGSDGQRRSKDIFQYNYQKNSLQLVSKMKYQRSSHAICYCNGIVYLIGGFSDGQKDGTRTCEAFNIKDKQCVEVAMLNAASANSCAVVFNQQYIFKFGGVQNKNQLNNLIQMYSIKKNKWIVVDIQSDRFTPKLQLLSFSAGVQINSQEIMIFGGYDNSEIEKSSNLCFTLQVNVNKGSVRVKNFNTTPLIHPEGFWNNNPYIYNGKVIALQNVTDKEDQLTALNDQRRIIIFDGDRWY